MNKIKPSIQNNSISESDSISTDKNLKKQSDTGASFSELEAPEDESSEKRTSPAFHEFKISKDEPSGVRLDKYLSDKLPDLTRSRLQRLIKDGAVLVNGSSAKVSTKLSAGDRIFLTMPEPEEFSAKPENIPLDILYEDDDLLIVNKPKGMVVHPAITPAHWSMLCFITVRAPFPASTVYFVLGSYTASTATRPVP